MLPESVRATGADILLGNTYHLWLRPGHELVRELGGLYVIGSLVQYIPGGVGETLAFFSFQSRKCTRSINKGNHGFIKFLSKFHQP